MKVRRIGVLVLLALPALLVGLAVEPWGRAAAEAEGPRVKENLDQGWRFAEADHGVTGPWQSVDLPHSWNVEDTIDGDRTYRMGVGLYQRDLDLEPAPDRRYFLRFEGANEKAWVTVNGKEAGSHKGGYTAFAFEITDLLKDGRNLIEVKVDNSLDREIMPIYCDFNFYGGIYRSVHLIETAKDCIAVTDYASPGLYLTQKEVSAESAEVEMLTRVSAKNGDGLTVRYALFDGGGAELKAVTVAAALAGDWLEARANETIDNPHLWNGRSDPYLYKVRAELIRDGEVIDAVEQPLGLRFYRVDREKGFFLNGEKYQLHGVCRHQDREGKANALAPPDHDEDFAIMREMGVNAVRLAHYPQASYAYSICDRTGFVVWAEIPMIGSVMDLTGNFLDSPEFHRVIRQQLVEMVRQNFNHPSILFWGLFNEIGPPTDQLARLISDLDDLANQEDPTRPTTAASNRAGGINDEPDLICFNKYFGWYYQQPEDFGHWMDKQHAEHPEWRLCVSEYGAGASVKQHSEIDYKVPTTGRWHPENWQTLVHEKHWRMIAERDYLWGSFLWNMFDFCVVSRREGDRLNINDKGMVTFDRKTRKDAFYFYKANWNSEPMIHITEKKFVKRRLPVTDVKVYSNAGPVELWVNGERIEMTAEGYSVHRAGKVRLNYGVNKVEAKAVSEDGRALTDSCEWNL